MANNINGVPLPLLKMENEFSRASVLCQSDRALAGNLVIYESSARNLPMDLSGDAEGAWMSRTDLLSLKAMAAVPGAVYPLEFNGANYNVRFRHEDAPVIEAEPIKLFGDPPSDLKYRNIRIKLTEM
jgi:hypothetical protein